MKNTAMRYLVSILCLTMMQATFAQDTTQCSKKLESWEELVGRPEFGNKTVTSLMSKHLTQEVWDALKDKQDSHGFTFKQAVFSGCKNVDSGIGVYAGSHDSYIAFSDLMNPIIEEYHGHKPGTPHESNMNYVQLKT